MSVFDKVKKQIALRRAVARAQAGLAGEVVSDIEEPADSGYDRAPLFPFERKRSIMKEGPSIRPAFPQVLIDLAKAMAAPGDALRGKLDPSSPEAVERALNIPIGLGAAGAATTAVKGRSAKGQLNTIMVPKELLDRNTPTMQIPNIGEVGFLGGPEKVNISLFRSLPLEEVRKMPLREIYNAPKTYDRFPEFRDKEVWVRKKDPQLPASHTKSGGFHPVSGIVQVDTAFVEGPFGLKGLLGHELTHAAQQKMHFPSGTNQHLEAVRRDTLAKRAASSRSPEEAEKLLAKMQDTKDAERSAYGSNVADGFLPYLSHASEAMAREGQYRRLPDGTVLPQGLDRAIPPEMMHSGNTRDLAPWFLGLPEKERLEQILQERVRLIQALNIMYRREPAP